MRAFSYVKFLMKNSPIRVAAYVAIILIGIVLAMPNFLPSHVLERFPDYLPTQKITLGLDLRGGSHLVLEVDGADLQRERVRNLSQDAARVLQEAGIAVQNIESYEQGALVVLDQASDRRVAIDRLEQLASPIGAAAKDLVVQGGAEKEIQLMLTREGLQASVSSAVEQSLEVIRQRVDQVGVAEPTIQKIGADRILVQLPGLQDPTHLRSLLGSTAKMSFHMLANSESQFGAAVLTDEQGNRYPVLRRVVLSGERLSDASVGFDQLTNAPVVNFRFDREGSRIFADVTRQNVGKPFAIVLDGTVLSAPVIREPIVGGAGQISGSFTVQEATTLAALLRAGALPAKLTVIEERSVGADLGNDVIQKGIYSGIAAFSLVFVFMFLLYGVWGLVADLALFFNVLLTLAGLSLLGATLTLPGIAGIILGIGLAVDANVLINERIREESLKGSGALASIDAGFRRAYATIMDSNVTALIGTMLLFLFGSGPVRGFAVTMALGIIISMFTAVSVVKVVMLSVVRRRKLKTIHIRPLFGFRLIPDGTRINFMRARFIGVGISVALSIASVALFIKPGLNYGIDFRGGIQVEVRTSAPVKLPIFRDALDDLSLGEVSLQEFGDSNHVLIRVERQPGGEAQQTAAMDSVKQAIMMVDPQASIERTEVVGPKISEEFAVAGFLSVILASLAMLIYIWIRFEWPFAVGAIVTLVLDVTKVIGLFAITGLDFNLTAIAALLTLVGYSVNDKVVVYDRMRENMRLYRAMPLRDIINLSINETMTRSIYTSATAFLSMLPLAIWGGNAVSSFAIPMVVGIVIAAASSIFIAAPVLLFLGDWRERWRSRVQQDKPPLELEQSLQSDNSL